MTSETPPDSPPRSARRSLWRAAAPWLVAAAALAWLLHRLPFAAVRVALATGPWPLLAAYVVLELALILLADAWAASVALRLSGGSLPYWRVVAMRGATYLGTVIHPLAGQGSFGWFLARAGQGAWSAGGVVLLLFVTQGLALVVAGAFGVAVAPAWLRQPALPLLSLLVLGLLIYLALLTRPPRRLARLPLLQPLFAAGVRGHLIAVAARLPHVALLVVLMWGQLRIWGIPVPLLAGLALTPLVLFVAALPITPAGLGTVQAL
ncbi:MAG TPA: lysylphosphatidylglycerol synthase domain-containing protein, partial [Thermoanaerobaculia bacterium]|nr:lysylphosphatidylglycerol synthase domain-containing protein [Thermoanaerobaculia bacterium]